MECEGCCSLQLQDREGKRNWVLFIFLAVAEDFLGGETTQSPQTGRSTVEVSILSCFLFPIPCQR